MLFRPNYSGGNEYAWNVKAPGFEFDQDLFFLNGNYSVSNKIVGLLFVCLSVVGLVVTSLNHFCLLRALFCNIAISV